MSGNWYCENCDEKITHVIGKPCPKCGYIDPEELDFTESDMKEAARQLCEYNKMINSKQTNIVSGNQKNKRNGFSDEEILATGLYPKDEGYKMSLISRILGKK